MDILRYKVGYRLYSEPIAAGFMSNWIKVTTEGGITRIRMDAICAYQASDDGEKLLIYTKDNSLFEITDEIMSTIDILDSEFNPE